MADLWHATHRSSSYYHHHGRSHLRSLYDYASFWNNFTDDNVTDFDSQLIKPSDLTVDAVVASFYFNAIVFVFLMASYEILRRTLPTVYSNRKKMKKFGKNRNQTMEETTTTTTTTTQAPADEQQEQPSLNSSSSSSELPDVRGLDWFLPVFGIPWSRVRKVAGLDGYFFLRYIRMNVRITAVTTVWAFLILVPVYACGNNGAPGWYHLSAANLNSHHRVMWVPCIFLYLFSSFIFFVVKQEYRHYLEVRQDFLARGSSHVHPQHHFSLMVENIPYELRSGTALADYFNKLFPDRVHSASVVMKLPDLEKASNRCMRSCRRLEKSIAYLHATGHRPSHVVGKCRLSLLGIDFAPLSLECRNPSDLDEFEEEEGTNYSNLAEGAHEQDSNNYERPQRGTRVDSISYYTQELAAHSRHLFRMQLQKANVALSGNSSFKASNWLGKIVKEASIVADTILDESVLDNALVSPTQSFDQATVGAPKISKKVGAEGMTSSYGSFTPAQPSQQKLEDALRAASFGEDEGQTLDFDDEQYEDVLNDELSDATGNLSAPFTRDQYRSRWRRWAGRLGLDYAVAIFRIVSKQIDGALESVVGATMSSTGFVTFLDLASTTCAASAPLTVKAHVLDVSVAPEPREIIWANAHVSKKVQRRREKIANVFLFLGAILWSFPLAAIQVFARAENLAQIPGMEWILYVHGGNFSKFVNGYLPVVALLVLICILPVLFEYIARFYERRKTLSDVQSSMLGRYFYYQLANIYVSVTAGSIFKALADILNHPSNVLQLLGESLPTMVGYFIALLVTKILAGLPIIFLRIGALSRMLLLRIMSDEKKLTQREVDAMYRLENVLYGWEFPTQLLVIVIVFTYAIICPVILPFGLIYFSFALTVYKKQILYVYSPVYESGGAMFPIAVQRTLEGLVCAQMTFLGYIATRGCYYQPLFLFPLPVITVFGMQYLKATYADPSQRLSLERAREVDRLSNLEQKRRSFEEDPQSPALKNPSTDHGVELRRHKFNKNSYRQPVLTENATEPMTYRRGLPDDSETVEVRSQLRQINRFQSAYRSGC